MRAADHDDGVAIGPRPGADRCWRFGRMRKRNPRGAAADDAAPQRAERRRADEAEERRPLGHERDIDRIFVAAGDEFTRAVERVDQKVAAAHWRLRLLPG